MEVCEFLAALEEQEMSINELSHFTPFQNILTSLENCEHVEQEMNEAVVTVVVRLSEASRSRADSRVQFLWN